MMVTELRPVHDERKSFYGKALVLAGNGYTALQSYHTVVCYSNGDGKLHRTWSEWSATTARHVNEFARQCGLQPVNKSQWYDIPCESVPNM